MLPAYRVSTEFWFRPLFLNGSTLKFDSRGTWTKSLTGLLLYVSHSLLWLLVGPSSSAAAAASAQPAAGLGPPQQFSKDVEDEANSYFQRIYNTSGSSQHSAITIVEQVLEMLKNFKDSPSDRDKVRRLDDCVYTYMHGCHFPGITWNQRKVRN